MLFLQLLQNYTAGVQDVVDMLDKMEWYIVPSLNVDGYYHTWEKVPLNSNSCGIFLRTFSVVIHHVHCSYYTIVL